MKNTQEEVCNYPGGLVTFTRIMINSIEGVQGIYFRFMHLPKFPVFYTIKTDYLIGDK